MTGEATGALAAGDLAERVRPLVVPVQVAALVAAALPVGPTVSPPLPVRAVGLAAAVAGGALAGAATLRLGRDLTPFVDPRSGASLRTGGVYAVSRHPMYLGMLLGSGGWTLLVGHVSGALATSVLAGVLHVKAGLEERRLRTAFGAAYGDYAARTPRLLPLRRRRR